MSTLKKTSSGFGVHGQAPASPQQQQQPKSILSSVVPLLGGNGVSAVDLSKGSIGRKSASLTDNDVYAVPPPGATVVQGFPSAPHMRRSSRTSSPAGSFADDTHEGDYWDMTHKKKAFLGEHGGAPLVGPNSNRRRSSQRKSMHKKNIMVMEEQFLPMYKRRIISVLDGTYGSLCMAIITIWALFGDDIRLLCFFKDADTGFVYMVYICLITFFGELVLASVAKKGYIWGFYFMLDAVATLSLLMDIPNFMASLGLAPCDGDSYGYGLSDDNDSRGSGGAGGPGADGGFARAGRASRAGTKAGRIVRIVRLVRIVKLYKAWQMKRDKANAKKMSDDDNDGLTETRVGQKLSDLTTRRVIVGVLMMLFCLPLFDINTYPNGDEPFLTEGGLKMIHEMLVLNGVPAGPGFYRALNEYQSSTDGMYRLVVNGTNFQEHSGTNFYLDGYGHRNLRCEEYTYTVFKSAESKSISYAFFDIRESSQLKAALNMCRTVFVCIVLGLGAMFFSKDANDLVLKPIERMVKKVRDVSENPLTKFEPMHEDEPGDEQMETRLLENSIAKICGLLAVGFGEAGSEVIAENMKRGGEINPMIPGKKVVAIFGFCDIRQFTDTTEVLQEGIMEFVNTIGKIVHMETHLHGGSANKNIGDAFLLVWKFPKNITVEEVEHPERASPEKREVIERIGNNALAAFIVIMAGLRRSAKLNTYRNDTALIKRIPDFEVKMGFGLHVGWAIEGAIGSEYKVDASYLSPNVNMSARLEAATKQFGVPLLLSENLVNILSERVRPECRQIDRVTVKGSIHPMGIYTYDTNIHAVPEPSPNTDPNTPAEAESNSFAEYDDEFSEHPDIVTLRKGITSEFLDEFRRGFKHYRDGEWDKAAEVLRGTSAIVRKNSKGLSMQDGPSVALLEVMQAHDFKAPADWKGFRELTEK
mmetsp:Transcript_26704/g.65447  ORF Transcript_26704/g.65447 Transcript_26704/m.65447 type:complete len:926 (-) Transcript_26704:528-3305(-)